MSEPLTIRLSGTLLTPAGEEKPVDVWMRCDPTTGSVTFRMATNPKRRKEKRTNETQA